MASPDLWAQDFWADGLWADGLWSGLSVEPGEEGNPTGGYESFGAENSWRAHQQLRGNKNSALSAARKRLRDRIREINRWR